MAQPADGLHHPEAASGIHSTVQTATGRQMMVVSAHPEATKAGWDVLNAGGNAVDAAIAIQLTLGLVEPQSSGLGGSGYTVYYDRKSNQLYSFDGRETAPSQVGRYLFTGQDGAPMDYMDAAVGGRAVGVPGMVRLLEMLHRRFGSKPWETLFAPAEKLAREGFTVTPRLATMVDVEYDRLARDIAAKLYFMPDGVTPINVGDTLRNPAYARVLQRLAREGADAFYEGAIPENIVRTVREVRDNPGMLSLEDFTAYRAIERKTVCGTYRAYMLCTMGESSAGGITLLAALGILEHFDLAALGRDNPQSWHLIAEASRLAMADRNYYLADPHFVQSPGEMLFDKAYLKERAALIDKTKVNSTLTHGVPRGWQQMMTPPAAEPVYPKPPGTTHFAVVDGQGNIVSMTSSVGDAFGSRLFVDGFMLNNQLADFSFVPEVDNLPVANRPEGGKRPRSSMAPTIVFTPQGKPFLVIGTAGGSAIPGYILQRIVGIIDWKMDVAAAMAMPNIINRGPRIEMEAAAFALEDGLRGYGHPLEIMDLTSGLTAIQFQDDGTMVGAADPRREGSALGR